MELQRNLPELRKRGLGLAAISYDAPETLKAFADRRGITFPLLSDAGSETIKRYGILNAEATGRTAGIPYPGTFVLDRRGIVTSRSFEESYQERATAASLAADATASQLSGGAASIETAHLRVSTSASDTLVAPGTRFSLMVDVAPKPRMHVYAPGQKQYIPVSIAVDTADGLKTHPMRFPPGEQYLFKPLNERQLVYSRPFRLVQDVTVPLTPAMRERARGAGATLTITATLRYQACDDAICYLPQNIPLTWTVALKPLER